jgi:hypothetical protein
MKKYLVNGLAILCLLTGIGGLTASAMIDSDETIVADIPFDFVIGDQTLPAGKYTMKVSDDTNLNLLALRNDRGRTVLFFQTLDVEANQEPRHTELVFNKIGDEYFLSRIWLEGSNSGDELEKSKAERRLEDGGMKSEHMSVMAQGQMSDTTKSR